MAPELGQTRLRLSEKDDLLASRTAGATIAELAARFDLHRWCTLPVLRQFRGISGAAFCSSESSDSEYGSNAFVDVVDQDVGQPAGLFAE